MKHTSWFKAVRLIINPETLPLFLIGAIFLSILGDSISKIVFFLFGDTITAATTIAVSAVLILFLSLWIIAKRLEKQEKPKVNLDKHPPKAHRGLILLVSRPEPCRSAINYHQNKLEKCWLICSAQSLSIAQELHQEFSALPQVKFSDPIVINDVYDPLEFYYCVKKIYQNLPEGWTQKDIIADFTGMTAQGSVGAVLASSLSKGHLQYTPAEYLEGKPTGRSLEPMEIVIKLKQRNRTNST